MEGTYQLRDGSGTCTIQRLAPIVCFICGHRGTYLWYSEDNNKLRTQDYYLCDGHAWQLALRMDAKPPP